MKVTLRASFTTTEWKECTEEECTTEGCMEEHPTMEHGWADVGNPWGGFDTIAPEDLTGDDYTRWVDENVSSVVYDDSDPSTLDDWFKDDTLEPCNALEHAARFVQGFSGGVWDHRESEPEQDFRTGIYREVTLHLDVDDAWQAYAASKLLPLPLLGLPEPPYRDPRSPIFDRATELQSEEDTRLREHRERMAGTR